MAKVSTKKAEAPKKTAKPNPPANILKVTETILDKLKMLNLEPGLQSDIVWCIGSYHHDKNPVGLVENSGKALLLFKSELAKKTKGITAKFIGDIEKALAAQQ